MTDDEKLQLNKKLFVSCFSNRGIAWCDKEHVALLWGLWKDWGRSKIRSIRKEKKIINGQITIDQLLESQCHDMSLAGIQKNRLIKLEWIRNICETLGVKHSQDTHTTIPHELVKKMHKKMIEQEKDIRNSFELRNRCQKTKEELTFADCTKLLNSIFQNYGFTKFVMSKRIQKRVDGKRVDVSEYKLEANSTILQKENINSDIVFEYIEMDLEKKRLLRES